MPTMLYQTHARVHLGNIRKNIEGIRKAIGPDCKMLIAVKGNAYGHGSVEVALMAERSGFVDWLGISTVPEAIDLRKAGLRLPILKISPVFPEEMSAAVDNSVTVAVCERGNIQALQSVCVPKRMHARVHLKVDTGMGRMGVTPEEAPGLAEFIEKQCPNVYLEGVFTHLPVSDDQTKDAYTKDQVARFLGIVAEIEKTLGRSVDIVHCSNSGGVLGHREGRLSMVRPGIMIYGYYPDEKTPRTIPLYPGLSMYTRISFLKKVKQGMGIGYGHTWTAPEDTWIGTIQAGYADGFNRRFSNRGRVLVNGCSYPVVGRVCMDQSMINLGPELHAKVGDEVVLIGRSGGEEITAYEWAKMLDTITYEVTAQINARVERFYDDF
jgi:alanine racemase